MVWKAILYSTIIIQHRFEGNGEISLENDGISPENGDYGVRMYRNSSKMCFGVIRLIYEAIGTGIPIWERYVTPDTILTQHAKQYVIPIHLDQIIPEMNQNPKYSVATLMNAMCRIFIECYR